jgi:hypothetical protein
VAWLPLPLPILRPERAAISGKFGLAQTLQQAMSEPRFADGIRQRNLPRSRADIQDFIDKTDDGLEKLFQQSTRALASGRPIPNEGGWQQGILGQPHCARSNSRARWSPR